MKEEKYEKEQQEIPAEILKNKTLINTFINRLIKF